MENKPPVVVFVPSTARWSIITIILRRGRRSEATEAVFLPLGTYTWLSFDLTIRLPLSLGGEPFIAPFCLPCSSLCVDFFFSASVHSCRLFDGLIYLVVFLMG